MIKKKIENIENQLTDLEQINNSVTKDLAGDAILESFENLIYYAMYEKLGDGETYSNEDLQKMYDIFIIDEEYEKCKIIKKILQLN